MTKCAFFPFPLPAHTRIAYTVAKQGRARATPHIEPTVAITQMPHQVGNSHLGQTPDFGQSHLVAPFGSLGARALYWDLVVSVQAPTPQTQRGSFVANVKVVKRRMCLLGGGSSLRA